MKTLIYNFSSLHSPNSNDNLCKEIPFVYGIVIEDGIIKSFINTPQFPTNDYDSIIDAQRTLVLPGLVECHTHSLFVGNRANEFAMKLQGKSYEEIAASGGGILSTANALFQATYEELETVLTNNVQSFVEQGVTTLEVKSGYGLSFEQELRMLQTIHCLKETSKLSLLSTLLSAHSIPLAYKTRPQDYLSEVCEPLLNKVCNDGLADYADAFIERSGFTPDIVRPYLSQIKASGLPLRLHTNQFNSMGGIELAIEFDALSVDHLEVISDKEIDLLSTSSLVAVLLPGVSYFLRYGYAPARKLIDSGITIALSTDFNPGSSHVLNPFLIMSLAAQMMKLSIEEILAAYTINAAKALGLDDKIGSIEIGKQADFVFLDITSPIEILYSPGKNFVTQTISRGTTIYERH